MPPVIVAPEVAARIRAEHTAGTSLTTLTKQYHLTVGEVSRVVAPPAATSCRVRP